MKENIYNAKCKLGEYTIRYRDKNLRVYEIEDNESCGIIFVGVEFDDLVGSLLLDSSGGIIVKDNYSVKYRIKGYEIEVLFGITEN